METLKKQVKTLVSTTEKDEQVKILQEINRLILKDYMIKLDDKFYLYPLEVEAYYYHETNFPDTTVHKNILQQNRFGQLYFHRAGRKKECSFLFDGGGVDICLSSGEYYFGVLIRSAWVNEDEEPICGPGLLTRRIVQHITGKEVIESIEEERPIIEEVENIVVLTKQEPIIEGKRFGINEEKHAPYSGYKLRALSNLKYYPFKGKEKIAIAYFEEVGGGVTMERIKDLLGFKSQVVYDYFNKKESE
jgi:hypothetical protein